MVSAVQEGASSSQRDNRNSPVSAARAECVGSFFFFMMMLFYYHDLL